MNKTVKYYAWIIWLLSASFLFYKYAIEVSPSIMANNLMGEFHIMGVEMGHLTACYFYAYLIMQIPVGLLIDRFGPRALTTIAILICALGSLLLSHAPSFTIACIGRFITGAGAAFAVISCLKLTTIWFPPRKFALMAGLMMTAGMLGAVGGEAPLAALVEKMGWRDTVNLIAIIGIVLAFIFFTIVRNENKHNSDPTTQAINKSNTPFLMTLKTILRSKQNWYLSIFSGLAFAPVAVIGGLWGVPFIERAYGVSKTVAASDVSLVFIGFAVGAPLFGYLSDLIKKRKPLVYLGVMIATVLISIIIFDTSISNLMITVLFFSFGFFISSFLISFSMIREINSLALAATSIAFMNTLNAALCAVADPFIGKLLDMFWDGKLDNNVPLFRLHDYQMGLTALPIFLIIGLIFFAFAKETHCIPNSNKE